MTYNSFKKFPCEEKESRGVKLEEDIDKGICGLIF